MDKKQGKDRKAARLAEKHSRARAEILKAAEQILAERGLEAVTLASVAGELHLTKQALYHYFPSKEALVRSLTTSLINNEIESILDRLEESGAGVESLGVMIHQFYDHYINHLDAFRAVYCQSQLRSAEAPQLDKKTIRDEINPQTRQLFDALESRLADSSITGSERARLRRLAFAAWLAALGLVTMLSIAHSNNDPLLHSDQALLDIMTEVFDNAAAGAG